MGKKTKKQMNSSNTKSRAQEKHAAPQNIAAVHRVGQIGDDIKVDKRKIPNKFYLKELAKLQIEHEPKALDMCVRPWAVRTWSRINIRISRKDNPALF